MKHTVKVALPASPAASYVIRIEPGLLRHAAAHLPDRRLAIIADTRVAGLYGQDLAARLSKHGCAVELLTFRGGEHAKNRRTKEILEDRMLKLRFDRSCAVVALGGGVTGDMAGFTAATFMRGIPVIQIPTTLLAQVDSSVGGKTAVDHPLGKNLIGAFHQPVKVLIDPRTLRSLPQRELLNGVAEIVKHGVIRSRSLFQELARNIKAIANPGSGYDFGGLVAKNCRIKARVVMADEKEGGLRRILNCGHTIGHAVETLAAGKLNHGEAVAIGLATEARAAVLIGLLAESACEAITDLLRRAGLPFRIPTGMTPARIIKATYHDKKASRGTVMYALPDRIGNCRHDIALENSLVKEAIKESR
ncbi:3-dehydroquinate synthase [Planctomycetota bacterium]